MIARARDHFDLHPARLAADTGYGSAEMLDWLANEQGIEPHVPVFDKSKRTDGTFGRDDFIYDQERDVYICPGGKRLTTSGTAGQRWSHPVLSGGQGRLFRPRS
jgi:hypothetical protein